VALFAGPFIDFLERLNQDENWRGLYGKPSPRLRDQEVVLRILAMYFNAATYKRPLKTFLNDFVSDNRDLSGVAADNVRNRFADAARLINAARGREALRRQGAQINAALTEAIFIGTLRRLDHGNTPSVEGVRSAIDELREDQALQKAVARATADEENVRVRLEISTSRLARA
jgi:hypothetical protein